MTNPIASRPGAIKSQAAPAVAALQEVAARRMDDIARKLRRTEEAKAMATDKTSTTEARGISKTASDLSRGASLLQVVDQGLDAIAASLRRIQSLIDKAADPATKKEERTRLQVELDTVRQEVSRVAQQTQANGSRPLDGSLGVVSYQTSSTGSTVVVPALPNLVMTETSTTTTSLGTSAAGAAQTAASNFDYPPPTVPGVVANNVQITTSTTAVAQTVTVRGTVFDLGTFVPDAKTLAAAINAVQGENGVIEAHADPNVLVGVSTGYRSGRGAAGDGGGEGDDHDGSDWPSAWGRRRLEAGGDWPGRGPLGPRGPGGHHRHGHVHHGHGLHGNHRGGGGRGGVDPSGTFTINGTVVQVAADARATDAERCAAAISAINAVSNQTGVVATDNGRGVTLTAADGRNMTVLFDTNVRNVAASTFGVATTGVEGKASTIDIRYARPCGCATGTVEFSASTGLDPQFLTLTVTRPSVTAATVTSAATATSAPAAATMTAAPAGPAVTPSPTPGIAGIDLNDVASLGAARRLVDNTLEMVVAARCTLRDVGKQVWSAIEAGAEVRAEIGNGNPTLGRLRYDSAARAVEGVQRLRELMTHDWGMGFDAQARNSSGVDALRAMGDQRA